VASWLLEHSREAINMTIAEVATATEVSEPTVIRCCRSLGLAGFRELRAELISLSHRADSYVHQDVSPEDSARIAARKVMESCVSAFMEASHQIGSLPLDGAVTAMANARQLIFCGLGASGYVARDAQHKFFRLGIPCSTALDAQTMLQCAAIASADDVFVAISHTGGWPEMLTALSHARDRGAKVVAISYPNSPLAQLASHPLACYAREDTSHVTPMSSRLVHLALLDGLQVALALHLGTRAADNLKASKDILNLPGRLELVSSSKKETDL